MGTLLTVALTIVVIAIALAGFFWSAYHTMHFDLPKMFIGAIIVLVALAILFGVLGFVFPTLAATAVILI